MRNKKEMVLGIFIVFGILFSLNLVASQEVSYCCEKLKSGAWCQNAPLDSCDTSIDSVTGSAFRTLPTSCSAASYCDLGYCVDSIQGTCSKNTPERVCNNNGGVWIEDNGETPPQCNLGCCALNDQAAFVTQQRCKKLSANYGLETDFRSDITSEVECIASVTSDVKGACVYEFEFEKLCKFTTQKDCTDLKGTDSVNEESSVTFHPDFLCSDETLGTNCGPSATTTCVEGRDEVYFTDTCGNLANIYDASRYDDQVYWSKIVPVSESCGVGSANVGSASATCGNCDYFLGSTCKTYNRGEGDDVRPNYGDYVCRDLSCDFEGETYQHGETWCADSKGIDKSLPGSRHFRMLCYNGDVTVEPCADFRQEVCLQSSVNDFKVAACRANMWQDCFSQTSRIDCENIDKRDCQWFPGIKLAAERQEAPSDVAVRDATFNAETPPFAASPITGSAINDPLDEANRRIETEEDTNGACLPLIAPGFNYWEQGDAQSLCALANKECIVKYEKGTFSDWECKENCECLEDDWELEQNNLCTAIGDCGNKKNFIGVQGYNTGYRVSSERVKD